MCVCFRSQLSKPQLNHNSTQPNITLVGLDMTLHTTPPHPTETQCQQYLSCYWPNFDETSYVGSWEHLKQWHLSWQHLSRWHLSISGISQLTQFWWNFNGSFLGISRTDSDSHSDICPSNICPGYICPYQEYLDCYWPDFDQTLNIGSWEHLEQIPTVTMTFVHATFVLPTFVHIRTISAVTD